MPTAYAFMRISAGPTTPVRRADRCLRWMLGRDVPISASGEGQSSGSSVKKSQWLMTSTDIDNLKQASTLLEKGDAQTPGG